MNLEPNWTLTNLAKLRLLVDVRFYHNNDVYLGGSALVSLSIIPAHVLGTHPIVTVVTQLRWLMEAPQLSSMGLSFVG